MRKQKRNTINKHHSSYDKATEHALRAIYEDVDITIDGQTFSYDKQQNILSIKDFCTTQRFKPKFTGTFCNPFAERIPEVINAD